MGGSSRRYDIFTGGTKVKMNPVEFKPRHYKGGLLEWYYSPLSSLDIRGNEAIVSDRVLRDLTMSDLYMYHLHPMKGVFKKFDENNPIASDPELRMDWNRIPWARLDHRCVECRPLPLRALKIIINTGKVLYI